MSSKKTFKAATPNLRQNREKSRLNKHKIKRELKNRLQELAEAYGAKPHPGGGEDRYICPWRVGADSSGFVINKNNWHDFVADEHGDCIAYVMRLTGCEFPEALEKLQYFINNGEVKPVENENNLPYLQDKVEEEIDNSLNRTHN